MGIAPLGFVFLSHLALAQDAAVSPPPAVGASPEAAPSAVEAAPIPVEAAPETTPEPIAPVLVPAEPEKVGSVSSGRDLPAPAAVPSRLYASNVSYNGGTIVAEGTTENPVRFESTGGKLTALRVQIDTIAQVVEAEGSVQLERDRIVQRRALRASSLPKLTSQELAHETLTGQNLHYDIKNQTGKLDDARVQLASFTVTTASLLINGKRYTAQNVVLRPGALSPEETKIYGTPPFNIRAKSISATAGTGKSGAAGQDTVAVKNAGLYFKSTRLLPLPSYVFSSALGGGSSDPQAFKVTPGISFNSADRVLITTRLAYPLAKDPRRLSAFAEIGLSQRIGLRGGIGLTTHDKLGDFTLRERQSDIVQTQLTNRIELDRKPELLYESPAFGTFKLGKAQEAGFTVESSYGSYSERRIGDDSGSTDASRFYNRLLFTTRLHAADGPFLRLFATSARYGGITSSYRSRGYQIGYDGRLLPRVRGEISVRSTSISGDTPFRFDKIEIRRELRSTFDIELTPRYLLPIDLRYDLSEHSFRDKTFGILRSYKTFAYGIVYQQARKDLRLEVRQGF